MTLEINLVAKTPTANTEVPSSNPTEDREAPCSITRTTSAVGTNAFLGVEIPGSNPQDAAANWAESAKGGVENGIKSLTNTSSHLLSKQPAHISCSG